jgi:NAD+-dependent protein deacetylase sirtuin 5
LRTLHGNLFDIKCFNDNCDYIDKNNTADPLCEALAPASEDVDPSQTLPLLDPAKPLAAIPPSSLPHCPKCKTGLLRPGVVWFHEPLDEDMLEEVDRWIAADKVDMMLVVGTSAQVWPAAGYIGKAKGKQARVVTINPEAEDEANMYKVKPRDFAFGDDAARLLPILLEPVIGKMREDGTFEE